MANADGGQVLECYTQMIYTSIFVKSNSVYGGDVTDFFTYQYLVGDSAYTYTSSSNYIEKTSVDGSKAYDFCNEINHSSGVHENYLYLNHSTFTFMSTSNDSVNELLLLSQFSGPDKYPTDNKILNTDVILEYEKTINWKGLSFILKLRYKLRRRFKNRLRLRILELLGVISGRCKVLSDINIQGTKMM